MSMNTEYARILEISENLREATPELVSRSQWRPEEDGTFQNTGGENDFPRIDVFPDGNKEGIKLGYNWSQTLAKATKNSAEYEKYEKLLKELIKKYHEFIHDESHGIFLPGNLDTSIKWLNANDEKLCKDYPVNRSSSRENKIYIFAATRNLQAAQWGNPDHQTRQAGLWVNIGQANNVDERKGSNEYRKKNAAGVWRTIATYRAPCFKDHDIHRYLKLMINHDPLKCGVTRVESDNKEEFFFIGDTDGQKACEIVEDIIKNRFKQNVILEQPRDYPWVALKQRPAAQVTTSTHSGSEDLSAHSALEGCIDKNKQAETLAELKAIHQSLSELKSKQPSQAQLTGIKSDIIGEVTQLKKLLMTQQANIPADHTHRDNRLIEVRDIIRQDIAQLQCSLPDLSPPAQTPGAQWTLLSLVMTLLGFLLGASLTLLP